MLLEREPFLTDLATLLGEASAGQGHVVFLSGEAGVGKTTLIREFCRTVEHTALIAVGACDPLSTPRPLGPLLDAAEALGNLEVDQGGSRDQLFRALLSNLSTGSKATLLIFEDVHWADEATLDLLRFLGRRISNTKALLVATYRDDEVGSRHPLRLVLGDLATATSVRRIEIPPLSEKAVRQLAEGSGLDAALLHQQTGGNPFFITEVLAAKGVAIPATVRDAVLARVARLGASSRSVLGAASIIGPSVESWLLTRIVGAEIGSTEDLLDSGMLLAQRDGYTFRHELSRQAVLSIIPPHRQNVLHSLVLEALKSLPTPDLARLAHHAEGAGDAQAVLEYAPKAAERATGLKAHREAAAQYVRALRFASGLGAEQKAHLLEAHAYECYLTDQLEEAIASRKQALSVWHGLSKPQKEGENLRWLSRLNWFLGHSAEAESYAQAALNVLQTEPEGLQLAMAYSNLSQLRMLTSDTGQAVMWGEKAVALARKLGDISTLSHALNNIGTAKWEAQIEEGQQQLEESLRLALSANLEEHIARAWTNLASGTVKTWQIERARGYLEEGINYATDHDLDSWRLYMQGWQAVWLVQQSRWDQALTLAHALIHQPRVSPISKIQALVALGLLRARRGDPEVWPVLDEALHLAQGTAEVQRLGPVYTARAEARWLEGASQQALKEIHTLYGYSQTKNQPWLLSEIAYWHWKLGDLPQIPSALAQPFALQIAGQWAEAAQVWKALGCPYEAARALSESDNEAALKEALKIFEDLGAQPMLQIIAQRLRELGIKGIPRGPRPDTKANPAGLTKRELEVLQHLVKGQSDKQIARNLKLSEKTVGHHVSAILGKLGKKSRSEAAHEAHRLGLLPN